MRGARILGALALVALGALCGTGQAATLTGPGGAVHGCVGKGGVLTVIHFKSKCRKRRRSVVLAGSGDRAEIAKLKSRLAALEAKLAGVSRSGHTLLLSGMNVELVSGAGSTSAKPNGLGNLIVGYNQGHGAETGSNNVVVGDGNSFTSYGGLVAGKSNAVSAPYATVTGGDFNLASDPFASVVGGCENVAGTASPPPGSCTTAAEAVLGGFENSASGVESTVGGGEVNTASGGAASVAGGQFNVAQGSGSAVLGGNGNLASGSFASVLGGFENSATTFEASVVGGDSNTASGSSASVLGGHSNTASGNCQAIPAAPGSC